MDRNSVINQFVLDFNVPGRRLTPEEILNYQKYGLAIKDDTIFEEVFSVDTYVGAMGYMPSVARMRYVQGQIERDAYESKQSFEEEEIAAPEEIHAIIQDRLKQMGVEPKKKAPAKEPVPGNLMEALPEHLKGLPEHVGTPDMDIPF